MLETMLKRRSIRSYKSIPLDKATLEHLVNAMHLAPSGNNNQAWKFIVVTTEHREEIAAACDQAWVAEAPAIIVALSEKNKDDYNLAFAVDHLLLEAADLELGTCVVRSFSQDRVKQVLGIPENYHVFALVPVGHPNEYPEPNPRKPLSEVLCWEKF